jgi:hypothetical protein
MAGGESDVRFGLGLPAGTGTDLAVDGADRIVRITSTIRDKTDLRPERGLLGRVRRLIPIRYRRRNVTVEAEEGREHVGLAAEQVAEIFPEAVNRDADGRPVSLDLHALVAALVGAVRELAAAVTSPE